MRERPRPPLQPKRNLTPNAPVRERGLRGTVKSIKKQEGFGFVTHTATGEDYFFHRSVVKDSEVSFDELEIDQEVEFLPSDGPKGLRAETLWSI